MSKQPRFQAVRVGDSWAVEMELNGRKEVSNRHYATEEAAMDVAIYIAYYDADANQGVPGVGIAMTLPEVSFNAQVAKQSRTNVLSRVGATEASKSALWTLKTWSKKATWKTNGVLWTLQLSTSAEHRDRVNDGFTEFTATLKYDQGDRPVTVARSIYVNQRGAVTEALTEAISKSTGLKPMVVKPFDFLEEVSDGGTHYS